MITCAKHFPADFNPKRLDGVSFPGDKTGFEIAIPEGFKIHTIRTNFDYWKPKVEQVQAGQAFISLRHWTDKPYNSKQTLILPLGQQDNVGISRLRYGPDTCLVQTDSAGPWIKVPTELVALNDGLLVRDFRHWFRKVNPKDILALIHFNQFRYQSVEFERAFIKDI